MRLADGRRAFVKAVAAAVNPDSIGLHRREVSVLTALDGDALVHTDLRADNVLLRPDGRVVLVDWPWASVGSPWFDAAQVVLNVAFLRDDAAADPLLDHRVFAGAPDGLGAC